ncbi:GntR family transcriptional regulator [Mycobacterium colombiense]|uniref:GntR family transcriptional regulator n=1 Tax=Mycobacterium colombiense TaxID=339268 RepID=UPI0009D6EBE9|nr:GntR family transcriptional regulator [Mycobacterium colombiense]MCK8645603.1 GntR family transcriptional regulator [Mycobacterium colombiense]
MPTDPEDPNRPSEALRSQADTAYQGILDDILTGELSPTESNPSSETTLQERYGLGSRMPVRMALAVLASEGLVAQRARHGFWIVDYSAHDMEQIGAMRADADAMVASFLGARVSATMITTETDNFERTRNALGHIRASFHAMQDLANVARERGVTPDLEKDFADHDTRFHTFMAAATDYTLAARHIRQWRNLVRLYRARQKVHYSEEDLAQICDEHRKLADLALRPVEDRFDGIEALIEQAATDHVRASLWRARVTDKPTEARQHLQQGAPLSITAEVPEVDKKADPSTVAEQRRAREEAETAYAMALNRQTILRDMANDLRGQL